MHTQYEKHRPLHISWRSLLSSMSLHVGTQSTTSSFKNYLLLYRSSRISFVIILILLCGYSYVCDIDRYQYWASSEVSEVDHRSTTMSTRCMLCDISVSHSNERRNILTVSSQRVIEELLQKYPSNDVGTFLQSYKFLCKKCFNCFNKLLKLRSDMLQQELQLTTSLQSSYNSKNIIPICHPMAMDLDSESADHSSSPLLQLRRPDNETTPPPPKKRRQVQGTPVRNFIHRPCSSPSVAVS